MDGDEGVDVRIFKVVMLLAFVAGCGGEGRQDTRGFPPGLEGEQESELSGTWRSVCHAINEGSGSPESVIQTKSYSGDSLLVTTDEYSDPDCLYFTGQTIWNGYFALGDTYEVSPVLVARDISETYIDPYPGISLLTWNAYFFVDGETLYFGADKGEGGDEPRLVYERPYTLVP